MRGIFKDGDQLVEEFGVRRGEDDLGRHVSAMFLSDLEVVIAVHVVPQTHSRPQLGDVAAFLLLGNY